MQEHEGVEVVEEEEEQVEEASSAEKSSAEKEESSGANDISIAADESQDEIKDSGEKPNEASPVAVEKEKIEPVQVNISKLSEKDRKSARANRFAGGSITGNTIDELKKKQSRAGRFGLATETTTNSDKSDNLKRRAERFGLPVNGSSSTTSNKISTNLGEVDAKKLKSRADRFGTVSAVTSTSIASGGDKLAARAARFGV